MAYQKNRRISYLVVILLFGVLVGLPAVNANVPDANAFAIGTNTPPALAGVAANNIVFLPALGKAGAPAPTSTSTRTPTPNGPTPTTSPSTNEWPMLAANPQRTSWSPEEVRGALNVAWYRPIEPYIPYKVQPIAAVGKIFVSTAKGLYAFSASNGSLAWVYPTELPLGHSPTVATVNSKSVAYVGGYDHLIHAVDTQTGAMLAGYTPYEAGAGFETNPLVIGNTIYAGNRDGYFYALDAATGSLKWRYQTGAEIRFSAAYKNGILYFASNDSYAYALNTSGGLVWKSAKLLGQGFYSYWPVIYTNRATGKDYLVLATGENYRFQDLSPVGNYSPGLVGVEIEAFLAGTPFNNVFGSTGTVAGDWSSGTVTLDASRITTY
ncbi:partial Serine/threonine-protein kinase AfsK, partial [Anaerolineae bacterium]